MFSRRKSRAAHARRAHTRKRTLRRRKLALELLEDRRVLAVMTVTSLTDDTLANLAGDSQLSLREAIEAINTGAAIDGIGPTSGAFGTNDEIVFDPALFATGAKTIDLDSVAGQLSITKSVVITGPSAGLLTIDAGNGADGNFNTGDGFRIFNIDDGAGGTDSPVTISGLTLTGGDVSGQGGAIRSVESLSVRNSEVRGNAATSDGGGIHVAISTGTISFDSSTISGNRAGLVGGGLSVETGAGTASVVNSTISGNLADNNGGGISATMAAGGTATVAHSTITDNTSDANTNAAGYGGGVYASGAGTFELENVIIAGNTDNTATAPDLDITSNAPGTFTIAFSLIGDNTGTGLTEAPVGAPDGTGSIIGDPGGAGVINARLAPLGNYGGPTQTHALFANSPAIDIGDPAFVPPPTNDQRGAPFVRVADGDGAGGARIDIGAYELQTVAALSLIVDTLVDENDGNYSPGDLSLREAVGLANGSVGADTITFAAALSGGTITLTLGELGVADAVTIDASSLASRIIIDASGNDATPGVNDGLGTRIFNINDGDNAVDSPVTLVRLLLKNGDVTGDGGAIRSLESLTVRESVIDDNHATADGGGIIVLSPALGFDLIRSTVSGNSAGSDGGGLYILDVESLILDSTISGNTAVSDGGGIYSDTSLVGPITTRIRNSTISGNTTGNRGGGVFNFDGRTVIEFSTITNNTAPVNLGGGVASFGDLVTRTEVYSTIIAGNANTDVDFVGDGIIIPINSFQSLGYNLIGDGNAVAAFAAAGDVTLVADPQLFPLDDYGGPTETHLPIATSPAIDTGNPLDFAGFGGVPEFDQRGPGFPRVLDGNGDVIPRIDKGAVEVENQFNGPQVTNVFITDNPLFDLFVPKPTTGPTPLVRSITVAVRDLPPRFAALPLPALNAALAANPGLYTVIGDANGIIPISQIIVTNDPVVFGQPATATIELVFVKPLPDDRFTLTVSDSVRDLQGNRLDGESNAIQPLSPSFPSGDGIAGGNFVARFTIDSRPDIGTWGGGQVAIDTNGNFIFDPTNLDFTNRDLAYMLGFSSDWVFAGNFVADPVGVADGFDKLAVYGRVGQQWRWLIDFNNDGIPDQSFNAAAVNGIPVAGDFDGVATNGDEVGVFTGTEWHVDTNHNFQVDTVIQASGYGGFPIVGDFNGDGFDDLATYRPTSGHNTFHIALATAAATWPTTATYDFRVGLPNDFFGFGGVLERPVAADMNADGVDDLGLWVPGFPGQPAHWYFFLSNNDTTTLAIENSIIDRVIAAQAVALPGQLPFVPFNITPFGQDIFAQFGNSALQPLVGNFDPPVAPGFAPFRAAPTVAPAIATQVAAAARPTGRPTITPTAHIHSTPLVEAKKTDKATIATVVAVSTAIEKTKAASVAQATVTTAKPPEPVAQPAPTIAPVAVVVQTVATGKSKSEQTTAVAPVSVPSVNVVDANVAPATPTVPVTVSTPASTNSEAAAPPAPVVEPAVISIVVAAPTAAPIKSEKKATLPVTPPPADPPISKAVETVAAPAIPIVAAASVAEVKPVVSEPPAVVVPTALPAPVATPPIATQVAAVAVTPPAAIVVEQPVITVVTPPAETKVVTTAKLAEKTKSVTPAAPQQKTAAITPAAVDAAMLSINTARSIVAVPQPTLSAIAAAPPFISAAGSPGKTDSAKSKLVFDKAFAQLVQR